MKITAILTIFLCFFSTISFTNDIVENIALAIRSGNAKELSKNFNANIDLNIPGNEGVFSVSQAEMIIKEFFSKNPPKSFSVLHQGTSKDGARYFIGNLITDEKTFRTYFYMKKKSDRYYIHELSFSIEK